MIQTHLRDKVASFKEIIDDIQQKNQIEQAR